MARLEQNEIVFEMEDVVEKTVERDRKTRWTHEAFSKEIKRLNDSIALLDMFVNVSTRMKCRCDLCENEWDFIPSTVLQWGIRCEMCDGKNKRMREAFEERLSQTHPTLRLIGPYVNSKTKVRCKCDVCGYEFEMKPEKIWKLQNCSKCAGTYWRTREDFLADLKTKNPTIDLVGTYVNMHTSTDFHCKVCGYDFQTRPSLVLHRGGCRKCATKRNSELLRRDPEDFAKEMAELAPNITIIKPYVGAATKVTCSCNDCGNIFEALPANLKKMSGCPTCKSKKRADSMRKTHEQFLSKLSKVNSSIIITGTYKGTNEKIECKCSQCGEIWEPIASNLLAGRGCPHCARGQTSFMEQSILLFLRRALSDCNNPHVVISRDRSAIGKELDIYIPDLHIAIEPGSYVWHKNAKHADEEKYNLCRQKDIRLIVLYDSFDGNRNEFDFDDRDFVTCQNNLGDLHRRSEFKDYIVDIFNRIGTVYSFSEEEEIEIFDEAKKKARRKTTNDIISELAEINPNIELLGSFRGVDIKMPCRCKICGHKWDGDYTRLITQRNGCKQCSDKACKKPVIDIDSGEIFESVKCATKQIGVKSSTMFRALSGKSKTCKGRHLMRIEDLSQEQKEELRQKFPDTFKY